MHPRRLTYWIFRRENATLKDEVEKLRKILQGLQHDNAAGARKRRRIDEEVPTRQEAWHRSINVADIASF
jgi:hypothetical protein